MIERENLNVSESTNSFTFTRATAQGNTLTAYGGFFREVVQGDRLRRPTGGLRHEYRTGALTSSTDREITILHELLHLAGNGVFSDQLLGSLISGRRQDQITRTEGSEMITNFLNRNCR